MRWLALWLATYLTFLFSLTTRQRGFFQRMLHSAGQGVITAIKLRKYVELRGSSNEIYTLCELMDWNWRFEEFRSWAVVEYSWTGTNLIVTDKLITVVASIRGHVHQMNGASGSCASLWGGTIRVRSTILRDSLCTNASDDNRTTSHALILSHIAHLVLRSAYQIPEPLKYTSLIRRVIADDARWPQSLPALPLLECMIISAPFARVLSYSYRPLPSLPPRFTSCP